MPDAARVCDDSGTLVAQNQASQDFDWAVLDADASTARSTFRQRASAVNGAESLRLHELGDGWRLEQLEAFQREQGSAAAGKAGRRRKTDLESLLSGLSHEIRNPLSAVLTAANLVQTLPGMDEETVMLLDVIRKESLRMNRILIEFSNYIKTVPPNAVTIDLVDLVRSVVEELRRDGVLEQTVEIDDQLPVHEQIVGDESQLRNAVSRVVQNAAEAIAGGGRLSLSCRDNETSVILCIADSGPGFSEESLERAFQPFYSAKPQAIGLGLSVALLAIEANGGGIWIDGTETEESAENRKPSSPGVDKPAGGACLCIRLPRRAAHAGA
jgi:signal transduction histidine kinase